MVLLKHQPFNHVQSREFSFQNCKSNQFLMSAPCTLCVFSAETLVINGRGFASAVPSRREQHDTRSFQKEDFTMTQTTGDRASVIEKIAFPWALFVCVSHLWANKLHEGKLWSTCSYCHAHTPFPSAHNTQYWAKMKKGAKPCARQRLPIDI